MKSILILVDYFGRWPKWFDMFIKTCEYNPTVNWLIHSDCPPPRRLPANVGFIRLSQDEYKRHASEALGIRYAPHDMYAICNLRPAYGLIHEAHIRGYDYFGWGDIDVLYGDIRRFYDDDVLSHNVISNGDRFCTGHLTLIRNEPWLREAFRCMDGWRERLEDSRPYVWGESLDEVKLSGIFSPMREVRDLHGPRGISGAALERFSTGNYFEEQWPTPFVPLPWHDGSRLHPETWYWCDGRLTNARDGERQFLYLHLMNFKGKRWVDEELYGSAPTWENLPQVVHFDCGAMPRGCTVRIDRAGIHLNATSAPGAS